MKKKFISRIWQLPSKSFLLFGPRGVGKSTLINSKLKSALQINLLKSSQYIPLSQNPSLLKDWVSHLKKGDWVFIDEVQKIPALMDEVHHLYEEQDLNFALSGSSARKMKRGGANLLAGRALQTFLFPMIKSEYEKTAQLSEIIDWGSLPGVIIDKENRVETLSTYVETYLKQELIEEGLIRKLDPFIRFLRTAGIYNGQVLNIENIARESHVGRTTVDKYFEILEDTLIGYRLGAIQLNIFSKENTHPKFYFFDSGVARAAAGLIYEEIDNVWRGFAFETYLLHEIRAYNHYAKKHRELFYYRVSGGSEIDLLVELKKKTLSQAQQFIGFEFKYSQKWDRRWSTQLIEIQTRCSKIKKLYGIYLGKQILTHDSVTVFPVDIFLKLLADGEIF